MQKETNSEISIQTLRNEAEESKTLEGFFLKKIFPYVDGQEQFYYHRGIFEYRVGFSCSMRLTRLVNAWGKAK